MKMKQVFMQNTIVIGLLYLLLQSAASASGFMATVSPPRFEIQAKTGKVVREIVEIGNPGNEVGEFRVRTSEWAMDEKGVLAFDTGGLMQNSCRPWVKIERRTVKVRPRGSKRYRFEIHVPELVEQGECRFALMIEPTDTGSVIAKAGEVQFPVQGRIAVIVYLSIDGAQPRLEFQNIKMSRLNGFVRPMVSFKNTGNAHGRPQGVLEGRDASGERFDINVSPVPILPGQTRQIDLWPVDLNGKTRSFEPPLQLKGRIEWLGGHYDINTRVE